MTSKLSLWQLVKNKLVTSINVSHEVFILFAEPTFG